MAEWKKILYSGSAADLSSLTVDGTVIASSFSGDGSGLTGIIGATSEHPEDPIVTSLNVRNHALPPQSFSPSGNTNPVQVYDEVSLATTGSWISGFGANTNPALPPGYASATPWSLGQFTGWEGFNQFGGVVNTLISTGPQYGGISTGLSNHENELEGWGTTPNATEGGGYSVGWFAYVSSYPEGNVYGSYGKTFTMRSPRINIPAGKTERFIIYYHRYGSYHNLNGYESNFKIYWGKNHNNRNSQIQQTLKYWDGSQTVTSNVLDGPAQQDSSNLEKWFKIEVDVSGDGYLYLDYKSGYLHADFALDKGYVTNEDTALDINMPDEDGVSTTKAMIKQSGEAHFDGDVVAYSSTISDERLKENILPITNSLSAVKNLQGVSYDWKYKPGTRQVGLLAQQVESQIPEVVKEYDLPFTEAPSPDTPYKTVSYQLLVPHLIEAIKELNARIEDLESLSDK